MVNATGLDAWDFSASLRRARPYNDPAEISRQRELLHPQRRRLRPFRPLIYPVPEPGGLGIHLTLDLAGQARFGPDVEWVDRIDYAVDPDRGERFYAAIRRYWPDLPDGTLVSAYAGIRPKTTAEQSDFVIHGPKETGHSGHVARYGLESRGLTASLAIRERVAELAGIVSFSATADAGISERATSGAACRDFGDPARTGGRRPGNENDLKGLATEAVLWFAGLRPTSRRQT